MRLATLLVLAACTPAPPPEVISIEPALGSVGGGDRVTLEGSGLSGDATIEIGGVRCTDVKAQSSERISCVTGSRDFVEGVADVVVSTDGGSSTLPAAYTYRCLWTTTAGRVSCGAAPPTPVAPQEVSSWVTQFEPGHGFVASGSSNLEDRDDHMLGDSSVWIETAGNGIPSALSRNDMGPFDMTGQQVKVWVKVDRVDAADAIELRLGSAGGYFAFRLASGQGQQWMTDGDWVAFTVSWAPDNYTIVGSPDRSAITDVAFRVADNGTTSVRLHVNGIALVPEPMERFPHGVLSFAFDDNWDSMVSVGAPELARHDYAATAYVIIDQLGASDRATLADLEALQAAGWDIAAHAFTDQHHSARFPWLAPQVVEDDMVDSRAWLIAHGFHGYDQCAFPGGDFDLGGHDVLPIAARYFSTCRTIYQRQREAWPPSDPLKLRVFYITVAVPLADAKLAIDRAVANHEWIIVVFHKLLDNPAVSTEWHITDFTALVDHVAESGIAVVPVSGVLAD